MPVAYCVRLQKSWSTRPLITVSSIGGLIQVAWTIPQYHTGEVDAAGQALVDRYSRKSTSMEGTFSVVNNWRSSHAFPLNTMQMYLRHKSKQLDPTSLVAQRVKRLSSIEAKLRRFDWLRLSEMQDMGGCRAVVRSVSRAERLVQAYHNSQIKHKLVDSDDYISEPKKSGYRGYHLIYEYHSDKKVTYNTLKIELQIRSVLQHSWATAVETVGTFTQQALKSSQGEENWLRFFALMSGYLAHKEKRPPVPNTPQSHSELLEELAHYARMLEVTDRLSAYGAALRAVSDPSAPINGRYFLMQLDTEEQTIAITGYRSNQLEEASSAYLAAERKLEEKTGGDAVLVSVESLDSLRRAYPNYFLDTSRFRREVQRALSSGQDEA